MSPLANPVPGILKIGSVVVSCHRHEVVSYYGFFQTYFWILRYLPCLQRNWYLHQPMQLATNMSLLEISCTQLFLLGVINENL
jgi:hypothetical protein